MSGNDKSLFIAWLDKNIPDLSESARGQLLRFADLVGEGGERMGLVARADLPRLRMRHLREAIAPVFTGAFPAGARVLDVGSGGGFPGIPLSILRNDIELTLLEPRHRRGAFLEKAVMVLGLARIEVQTASIDAFSRSSTTGGFGWIVSRGVAWSGPMVRCLEKVAAQEANLIRFGAPELVMQDVEVHRIQADVPRAIQIWPRRAWGGLPGAR